jgi:hypothetical protein
MLRCNHGMRDEQPAATNKDLPSFNITIGVDDAAETE